MNSKLKHRYFNQTGPNFRQTILWGIFSGSYTNEPNMCYVQVEGVALISQTGKLYPSTLSPFSLDLAIILIKLLICRPLNEWFRSSRLKSLWDIIHGGSITSMIIGHTCLDYVGKANCHLLQSWTGNHHPYI